MSALSDPGRIEPGQRFDRYEVLCPIAEGGMASVWLARLEGKHGFEKLVAIKTILPKFAMDDSFQKMLLDEARIASGIEHANVAQILDLGEQHDVTYVVLEWVEGDSLSRLARAVKRQDLSMPPGILLRILADACGGLHAAHELRGHDGRPLGVVHRDVSPQNILINTAGVAKVIDFGIAKARDRLVGETSAGVLKGKVRYMAPEQAMGRPTDRRADVWAVGAVLYRLIAGTAPFEGANELASLNLLMAGRPPAPLPPTVPPSVRALVSRALSHELDARFATAADMQSAMEQAMVDAGIVTTASNVAAFAATHLAPYAQKRKQAVQIALAAAAERQRVRAMMQPLVFPEVSTDVSRLKPEVTSEPTLDDSEEAVTVHLAAPRQAARSPVAPPPRVEALESLELVEALESVDPLEPPPVSGFSMRTTVVAACGVVALLAFGVLLALHESSHPASSAAKPPEAATHPVAVAAIPPPPPPASAPAPVATPQVAAAPAPAVSVVAATDLPRAAATEIVAKARVPSAVPVPTPSIAAPPAEVPKAPGSRRVDDGF
jgi:eukaryotic-like serine/threonine-protein kinase